jgi:two-component system OmpR family response regulator
MTCLRSTARSVGVDRLRAFRRPISRLACAAPDHGDRSEPLTPTEFRLLAALAARQGEVVRRRDLVAAAWPDGAIVHDNSLDSYVARLRRKLRTLGADATIATARGVGYRLP